MKNYALRLVAAIVLIAYSLPQCNTKMFNAGTSLMSTLETNPNLSSFTSLLKTPDLAKAMGKVIKSPFTLLAPTNSAMSSMSTDALNNLTKPGNVDQLASFLKGYVLPGKVNPSEIAKGGMKTAGGTPLNLNGVNLGNMMTSDFVNIIPIDKILQ